MAEVNTSGEVSVEGQFVGKLEGFRFQLDQKASGDKAKTLKTAAIQALQPEFIRLATKMYNAPDTEFDITEQGGLMWGAHAVGKLVKGAEVMAPMISVFVDDEAGTEVAEKIERRLSHFVERRIESAFEPLIALKKDEAIDGIARGVSFRLIESLGVIPRSVIANDIKGMEQDQRGLLRKHGVRFGQYTIFQHLMLKPAPTRLRLVLWSLFEGLDEFPEAPPPGLVTIPETVGSPKGYYPRAGYRMAGSRAIRIDMLERLADLVRKENVKEGFEGTADMLSITGMTLEQFAELMQGLGYSAEKAEREKVKAVVEEAKAETPDVAPVETESTVESVAETTETVAEVIETVEEKPDEAAPVDDAVAAKLEDTTEVFYTLKWQVKRRPEQQNQRPGQEQGDRGKPRKQGGKPAGKKGGKPRGPKPQMSASPKQEKPIDPDNPFAALMALKNKG